MTGALALALVGCATEPGTDTPDNTATSGVTATPTVTPPAGETDTVEPAVLTVTSTDFADGEPMPETVAGEGYGGQCTGPNTSPQLAWDEVPAGTVAFAVSMTDPDAGNYVHALKANIPAEVATIDSGAWDATEGIGGRNGLRGNGYFGPCPPQDTHTYEFTVYALSEPLDLEEGFGIWDFTAQVQDVTLAVGTLAGTYTPAP